MILDNGAFHKTKHLSWPLNVRPLFLPPYAPELNPAEKVWWRFKRAYTHHKVSGAYGPQFPQLPFDPPVGISQEEQLISYTPFSQPDHVTEVVNGDALDLTYHYGPDYQRTRSVLRRNGQDDVLRWYVGAYKKQQLVASGITHELHYIPSGNGLCAIIMLENGAKKIFVPYKDHVGSIVAVTNGLGNPGIVTRQNFDAWGQHRDPLTWDATINSSVPSWLYRAFTGHEDLPGFALVNMNGRMYDPVNGRMLSLDNYVASPSRTETLNRYAYCNNNPLKYTDPSGQWVNLVIGAAIGGVMNLVMNNYRIDNGGDALKYFLVGTAVGAVSAGVGSGVSAAIAGSSFAESFVGSAAITYSSGVAAGALAGAAGALRTAS